MTEDSVQQTTWARGFIGRVDGTDIDMGTLNFLLSLFGWTFVPDFATNHLLNIVYRFFPLITPQPGSLQYRKHYAFSYGVVVISYLTYTLVQSSSAMPPNFYEILGVRPDVDENGLKLAFRTFARRYHPDKAGPQGEQLFMYVRDAFEALKDPVVRFAYDRFGPDAVSWRHHCKTSREFLKRGLMVSSGYHIVTGIALLFWSAIGKPSPVSFWRYILFAALFAAELSFILSSFPVVQTTIPKPANPVSGPLSRHLQASYPIFQTLWPNRIPYQHILFLHQLFMFLSVALTRVVPTIVSLSHKEGPESRQLEPFELAIWERIHGTLAVADREASVILHTILQSVNPANHPTEAHHDPSLALMQPLSPEKTRETLDILTPEMHAMVVEANIKNHTSGPIQTAWKSALATSKQPPAESTMDRNTYTTVKEELPRTPNSLWDEIEGEEDTEEHGPRIGSPSKSSSVSPTLRREALSSKAEDAPNQTKTPSPGRNSSGPSAGEF